MTDSIPEFEFSIPVVVVGGGASGCIAALSARLAGADVLLVEQDAVPSGTTSMSQGLICAGGTKAQAAHGVDDSGAQLLADIIAKTRGQTDGRIAAAIAHGSGPTIDWMVESLDMPWTLDTGFRAAYGHSRLRVHGWPGHGGIDMVPLLHRRLAEHGVDVLLQAKLVDIVADADGKIRGILLERPGGVREAVGCDTLILASGGFAGNHDMVATHMPEAARARYNGHEGSQGDGIRLGAALGAALGDMGAYQGYAMLTDPQMLSVPPSVIIEGGFMVNRSGHRFVNEADDIAGMAHAVLDQENGQAWVIFDAAIESRCAYIPETAQLMELNAAKIADSIDGLAAAISVDPASLAASFADALSARAASRPDATGRIWGDDNPPSPPYRALKVCGAIYHTQGGLQTDGNARVLRPDGTPLPNLFASGGAARGVSGPSSWGYLPAMGLCAAVTTGRLAGLAAAAQALSASN